jgi:transposase-like protein
MPRKCTVCALEEHLPAIDQRLRDGESVSALAREYSASPDALERHRAKHLRGDSLKVGSSLTERLELLWTRCDDLYKRSVAVSDVRTAVDALNKLVGIAENLSKVRVHTGFESLTLDQKVDYVIGCEVMVALGDRLVKWQCDADERERMQREREEQSRYRPPENFGQPSDAVK